jgi:hypothetical protein
MGLLRQNRSLRRYIEPSTMKIFELLLFLVLAWHYIGCFWWALGDSYGRPVLERLRVLDSSAGFAKAAACAEALGVDTFAGGDAAMGGLDGSDEAAAEAAAEAASVEPLLTDYASHYLASVYWAVLMTTGLNVPVTPGVRAGLVLYESLVAFLGVCLLAYMLGATASEIANMDAQDTQRRQRLKEIKQHLRALRVPVHLREPINEYYERETSVRESQDAGWSQEGLLKDLPSTLKVQLAVTLSAEFLRSSAFFADLSGTLAAALVLAMRPRVCLPSEVIIHQGDVSYALFFIRSGRVDVLRLSGPVGLEVPEDDGDSLGDNVATLHDGQCFGEQSFLRHTPSLASCRARGYVTLYQIFKVDFERVQSMFPQVLRPPARPPSCTPARRATSESYRSHKADNHRHCTSEASPRGPSHPSPYLRLHLYRVRPWHSQR